MLYQQVGALMEASGDKPSSAGAQGSRGKMPPPSVPRGVPKPRDDSARRIRILAASNSSLPKSGSGVGFDSAEGNDLFNHTPPNFTPCSYEILGPKVRRRKCL